MKIVVDENMPYAIELFNRSGEVMAVAGRSVTAALLGDIDALMVRSVTRINEALLGDSRIKFVGSATAGTDHIDTDWLAAEGITFASAPGCNAIAVVEYVFSALLMLAERDGFNLSDRVVGIVGAGNVGGRLQQRLSALGVRTLICDPPLMQLSDNKQDYYDIDALIAQADVLTLHTPLNHQGPYQSWHLIDEARLRALRPNTILINTCRGAVVDNAALQRVLHRRHDLSVVLDVWEPEPNLAVELLNQVDIATAHIAGYTLEGKARGTIQIWQAWNRFLGHSEDVPLETLLPAPRLSSVDLHGPLDPPALKSLAHMVYDVRRDDVMLRKVAGTAGEFDRLRKTYWQRREWSSLRVTCDNQEIANLVRRLGFKAVVR